MFNNQICEALEDIKKKKLDLIGSLFNACQVANKVFPIGTKTKWFDGRMYRDITITEEFKIEQVLETIKVKCFMEEACNGTFAAQYIYISVQEIT